MPENHKSKDYRDVFSNTFGMQFSDNDVRMTFGHALDLADPARGIVEEVSVFMTPRSAKMLMVTLKNTIERFEKMTGVPIPLPPAKMEEIEKSLAVIVQTAKPST